MRVACKKAPCSRQAKFIGRDFSSSGGCVQCCACHECYKFCLEALYLHLELSTPGNIALQGVINCTTMKTLCS